MIIFLLKGKSMFILRLVLDILYTFLGLVGLWAVVSIIYSFTVTEKVYKKSSWLARIIAVVTTWGSMFFTRSKVTVLGKEKIPTDTRFVYVANHVSRFDPMVVMYKLARSRVAFISKPSNFKIPFFGKIIRKLCFLEINREDPREAMGTLKDAADILKFQEASIGFYPEGTRSKDGKLGPFHNFMFRIPVMAQVPVVVAVTTGTDEVAKRFPFPGGAQITIKILGVLDVDYINSHRPVEIGQRVEAMMREELGQVIEAEAKAE